MDWKEREIRKIRRKRKWAFRSMKFMAKIGLPSARETMGELYASIVRETEQGKIVLENLAEAGDLEAQMALMSSTPGAGMECIKLKAAHGDRVAQMLVGGYDDK